MKGYRTIVFSAFMTMVGMFGWKISPDTAGHWVDMFLAAWGIGAILLRQMTTTPVGNSLAADAMAQISADLKVLLGHSTVSLQASQVLVASLQQLEGLAPAIASLAAAASLPNPVPVAPAGVADATVAVPAPVAVPLSTDAPAPAQPIATAPAPQPTLAPAVPVILPVA